MLGSGAGKGHRGLRLDLPLDPLCPTGPSLPASRTPQPFAMCPVLSRFAFLSRNTHNEKFASLSTVTCTVRQRGVPPRCHAAIARGPPAPERSHRPALKPCLSPIDSDPRSPAPAPAGTTPTTLSMN